MSAPAHARPVFDYDVIVVGLGAMGSAAAWHLVASGRRVLGLDRFAPPHQFGSSHGLTRIIREAYFEHPMYVPLIQRAYQLWAQLERCCGRKVFSQTGGLMIGLPDGMLVKGARRSAEQHGLPYRLLSSRDVRTEFPALVPTNEMVAVWEPRAGILFPELAIQAHLALAAKSGACLKFNCPVTRWEPQQGGVRVETAGATYTSRQLLLSAGSWVSSLLPDLNLPLSVERQVLFWFQPLSAPEQFNPARLPIFICEFAPGRFFYGFPDLGDGIKVAAHHEGVGTLPDSIKREVEENEIETMRALLKRFLPGAAGGLRSAVVCMYTNTPDEHFILDYHPAYPQVLIVSPCSGHGFKFSPVIGELAAGLLNGQSRPFDLSLFSLRRFGALH
jgi:sarcosine oxidase